MKKLIVFGPTGRTGLAVLQQSHQDADSVNDSRKSTLSSLLASSGVSNVIAYNLSELEVTAFLRTPQKVPADIRSRIKIIIGDVMDAKLVADALIGQDTVISSIGTGYNLGDTTVISEGLRNILDGMRKHGIKHITVVGVSFLMPNQYEPYIVKKVGADHKRAFEILKRYKDINWICTAPPQIASMAYTGTCKATVNKLDSLIVTTHDLADWMLRCSKDPLMAREYTHELVGISSTVDTFTWLVRTRTGRRRIFIGLFILGCLYYAYSKLK